VEYDPYHQSLDTQTAKGSPAASITPRGDPWLRPCQEATAYRALCHRPRIESRRSRRRFRRLRKAYRRIRHSWAS